MKNQRSTFLLSLAGTAALIIAAVVLVLSGPGRPWAFPKPGTKIPGQLPVAEQPQQPASMSWNPDSLVVTLSPGESKREGVGVRYWDRNTPPPVLQVPPALAPFVTVTRGLIGIVPGGKWIEYDFDILVTVASGIPFQTLSGSLTGSGVRPLPITLNIWPGATLEGYGSGVGFGYPPGWNLSVDGPLAFVYDSTATTPENDLVDPPAITVKLLPAAATLSLEEFIANYDGGWYSRYETLTKRPIGGLPALLVSDSELSPPYAVFVAIPGGVLFATAGATEFDQLLLVLNSMHFNASR